MIVKHSTVQKIYRFFSKIMTFAKFKGKIDKCNGRQNKMNKKIL